MARPDSSVSAADSARVEEFESVEAASEKRFREEKRYQKQGTRRISNIPMCQQLEALTSLQAAVDERLL
jgi:hypothetical protein